MKLLFASDLHGSARYCQTLVDRFAAEGADRLVLLGDLLYHGPRNDLPDEYDPKRVCALLNPLAGKILAVRGNCDAEIDQMVLSFPMLADYAAIPLGDRLLYLAHGHKDVPPLQAGDLLLNGHFHVPACEPRGCFQYLNCGSLALPKDGTPHSYLLYEDGEFTWKTAKGEPFMTYSVR